MGPGSLARMRTNPGRKFPALLASKSGKWQKTEKIEDQIVAIVYSIPVAELCCRLPGAVPEDSQSSSPGPLHLSSFPSQVSAAKPPAYRSPALGHPEPPHSRAVHYGRSGLIHGDLRDGSLSSRRVTGLVSSKTSALRARHIEARPTPPAIRERYTTWCPRFIALACSKPPIVARFLKHCSSPVRSESSGIVRLEARLVDPNCNLLASCSGCFGGGR